ncbi:MAG: serine/threonine-protein phosphatase, partial [Phycisphaerales bacterium]|nr:serine/threonine-protein phosphatase [Phycisphaerales bacterium]
QLVPGDILVSYTDGVTEAMNYDEREYGYDRLLESIRRYRDESAGTLANQILWDVRRYAGLVRQSDDISVVVAKVK